MTDRIMRLGIFAAGAALVCAAGVASGDDYDFQIREGSSLSFGAQLDITSAGFLIGDFDANKNPGGTRTVPGLFGGPGNEPVDLSADFGLSSSSALAPAASFIIALDVDGLAGSIELLNIDLIGDGANPVASASAEFVWEVFRSFNPDSLFPGGIPVDVPLGDAEITDLILAQSNEMSQLTLIDTGKADEFDVVGLVPVTITGFAVFEGQAIELGPLEGELPIVGVLNLFNDRENATLSLSVDVDEVVSIDEPFGLIEGAPFGLPTVIPPGDTANVLISLDATGGATSVSLLGDLIADGVRLGGPPCPVDWDQNGEVNAADVGAFLTQYFIDIQNGTIKADFDGNGVTNAADVGAFLSEYFLAIQNGGC